MEKAVLRPGVRWHKKDCLFCEKDATQEACFSHGTTSATIRCCASPECEKGALDFAEWSVGLVKE